MKNAQRQPGYGLLMMKLIEITPSSLPEERTIRQLASIIFKNYIKANWPQMEEGDGRERFTISEDDRASIKQHVVALMCVVPPEVQRQVSEQVQRSGLHVLTVC
jgi:exportin-2 (importin alpha re-exporter)